MCDWSSDVCSSDLPWEKAIVTHSNILSKGFFRQEYWSGLPFPPPWDHPDPGITPGLFCLQHCRQIIYHCATWEEPLGKEMATHSSILDWEIPWTEEPGRLQSVGP